MRKILIFTLLMALAPLTASAIPLYFSFEGHTSTDSVWNKFDKDDLLKEAGLFGGGNITFTFMIDFEKSFNNDTYHMQYISSSNDKIHKINHPFAYLRQPQDMSGFQLYCSSDIYGPNSNMIRITDPEGKGEYLNLLDIGIRNFRVVSLITTEDSKTAFYEGLIKLTTVTSKPPHAPVPEPATYALLLLGILAIGGSGQIRRWRHRA